MRHLVKVVWSNNLEEFETECERFADNGYELHPGGFQVIRHERTGDYYYHQFFIKKVDK